MEGDVGFELRVDPNKDKTALISKNNNELNPITFKKIEKVCRCKENKDCTCHPDHLAEKTDGKECCSPENIEQDTDAYGDITFVGFKKNTRANYVRLSDRTDPADVTKYMQTHWQFGDKSQLLISVLGSPTEYTKDKEFEKQFKKGLIKVARMTSALVLTDGKNAGITKIVGLALRNKTQMDSTTPVYDRERSVRCIGILPWGILPKSSDLVKPNGINHVKLNVKLPKQKFLDQNHSYFLLIDDGSKDQFHTEIKFKTSLEKYILEYGVPGRKGNMRKHVGVALVIGGGLEIINQVKETVENKMSLIIFKRTGFAAELLIFAYDLKPLENCNLRDLQQHQKLIELIGKTFPDLSMAKTITCYDTIMECMRYKTYITLSILGEEDHLDEMILNAFLQVYKAETVLKTEEEKLNSISNQLKLAIHWGCYDNVEFLLKKFDENLKKKKSDEKNIDIIIQNMVHAISISRHEEARVLMEYTMDFYDGNLNGVITKETLLWLYQSKLKKKKINILHLLTDKNELTLEDMRKDFLDMLKDFGDINNEDFEDDVFMQLFFYAILSNMQWVIVLFLFYGGHALPKILLAYKLYGSMKDYYLNNKNTEEKWLINRLTSNEEYFGNLALDMLDECTKQQQFFTRRLLCQEPEHFGFKSCLALAASTRHIDFVSHDTCQLMLTEHWWCGRIVTKGDSWFIHGLKVFLCLLPPCFLFLQYKTREMEKVEGKTTLEYESNQLHSHLKGSVKEEKTRSESIKETVKEIYYKGKYFYDAPITKCASNVLSYFLFVGFFAFVVTHQLKDKVAVPEWIVAFYILAFIIEEFRQIVQAPVGRTYYQKFKNYFSSFENMLDVFALALFIGAFALRMYTDKLIEAHVLYAVDIFFWIIRLLSVFAISPELGPYVEMIRRMVTDLLYFVFVLAVFLLAYGIARFAILSPMNDSTFTAATAIFSVPYKQMYADAMDEVGLNAPANLTVFNTSYSTVVAPVAKILMAGYTLLAAVLLMNLLIARFSYVYDGVQVDSKKIWKFNRYFIMQEYQTRSAVPMPFSIIPNIYEIVKTLIFSSTCCPHSLFNDITEDEKSELAGFERECLALCTAKDISINRKSKHETLKKLDAKNKEALNLPSRLESLEDDIRTLLMQDHDRLGRERALTKCDFDSNLKADVHYPLTATKRFFVTPQNVSWNVEFPEYAPNNVRAFFPSDDDNDNTTDRPRNPLGRSGLVGKGLLKTFGSNEIVETIVTRWKPGLTGIELGANGLKILQVLVIKEIKSGTINIPIGPVTKCESHKSEELIPPILSTLFHIDILNDENLRLDDERKRYYTEKCEEILSKKEKLYDGAIEDPRNTDDAWIESVVINYHDQDGRVISKYLESKYASDLHLEWMDISSKIPLSWRYYDYLKKIALRCNAQF
ncbi:transient receptor potential cation channel subfamily M member 7-like isoform X2 [Hydractinia symbiolongicarpus]|uniref:transient receptor potential cation channel subfamily M member 7-like isoform X2 n=1 Tax=Hydractinia symbiolongicarpus TaxID=13093 RepID=UPI0025519C6A|nr:transient receptor potential cation channel subfamily M member 7-like isoform X2 [Hydractinia symbiolongicarpus]